MFDFLVELALNFAHEGLKTPFDTTMPIPWGPHHKI
jgi:hypothetical protein